MGAALLIAMGVAAKAKAKEILARLTRSGAASRLGLSNQPDDDETKRRLVWLDGPRKKIENILREKYPSAHMTSAYRNSTVNEAVGGVKSSYHRHGLALDFGVDGLSDYQPVAKWLAENVTRVGHAVRTIYAETTPPHLHIEMYDPFKKIDKGTGPLSLIAEPEGGGKPYRLV